ncbi:MAG: hypothetical protein K6F14_03535 [Clostridiales bacterium]|nr:hypothetical protein [Clostridiales bacterium]
MASKAQQKTNNTAKIVLIVGLSIIAVLLVLTLVWMLTSYFTFNKYVDAIKERGAENWTDTASSSYGFDKTRYQYFIGRPSWLSWSGNLVISMPSESISEALALYPDGVNAKVSGGKVIEYTADITTTSIQGSSVRTIVYYIKVDKNGNYISTTNEDSERALEVYQAHSANIKNLVHKINSIWGFTD